MRNNTLARVILAPDGNVHIAYVNGQTFFCTAASLLCLLSDPYHFLEKAREHSAISTYLANPTQVPLDEIRGLTLLAIYSDKKIVCDFPELFQLLSLQNTFDPPEWRRSLRIDAESLNQGDYDAKKACILLFLAYTQLPATKVDQFRRNIHVSEETLSKIVGEILEASAKEVEKQDLKADVNMIAGVNEQPNRVAEGCDTHLAEAPHTPESPIREPDPIKEVSTIVTAREYAKYNNVPHNTVLSWIKRGKLKTAFQNDKNIWFVDKNETVTDGRAGRTVKPKADGSGRKVTRLQGTDYESVQLYIRERRLFSDKVRPFIRTAEEAWYYERNSYHEVAWNIRSALIIDVNPEYKNRKTGETNRERMLRGDPPYVPGSETDVFQLHHIGQKPESPFAIIPQSEHNKEGNKAIFHPGKACAVDLHGQEFAEQKAMFWMSYIRLYDEYGSYRNIPFVNSKHKRKEADK